MQKVSKTCSKSKSKSIVPKQAVKRAKGQIIRRNTTLGLVRSFYSSTSDCPSLPQDKDLRIEFTAKKPVLNHIISEVTKFSKVLVDRSFKAKLENNKKVWSTYKKNKKKPKKLSSSTSTTSSSSSTSKPFLAGFGRLAGTDILSSLEQFGTKYLKELPEKKVLPVSSTSSSSVTNPTIPSIHQVVHVHSLFLRN